MPTHLPALSMSESPLWLWTTETHPNQTLLFRAKAGGLEDFDSITLRIAANTRYYLSLNGSYLAQGPCPGPKSLSVVDSHVVKPVGGILTIAVVVHFYGVDTQSHSSAPPGLWCQLVGKRDSGYVTIDLPPESWRLHEQGGWLRTGCRRSWASGWAEQFDAARHPQNWQSPDFDDSAWALPDGKNYPGSRLMLREVPALREWFHPAVKLIAAAHVAGTVDLPEDGSVKLGQWMDEEPRESLSEEVVASLQESWNAGHGIALQPNGRGLALLFDLGEEVVGQTEFAVEASEGCVDHYGAERLKNGRPLTYLKGADYAGRWFAAGTEETFRTLNYNGFRYLMIVLRPQSKPMRLLRFGAWRRQADIEPQVEFRSEDPELQRLWETSLHTIQVGTQETAIDCPTREQALFIGDGLWHSLWLARIFNEPSYLHHFFVAIRESQDETTGLVCPAVFRGSHPPAFLLDYCLIYVWGMDVYRRALPGHQDRVKTALASGERVLKWFEERIGADGLLATSPDNSKDPDAADFVQRVFIDHPGMGWHMQNEPGLARSHKQQGLNAFLVIALEAFLRAAEATGYEHQLDLKKLSIPRLREQSHRIFFEPESGLYADCVDAEGAQRGWSEHSQILAVLAKFVAGPDAHALMTRIMDQRNDAGLCKCTPYFWIYYAEALSQCGHAGKIIPLVQEAWSGMNNDPAVTTWWECFGGDELDSYCHPWSAVPAWLLQPGGPDFNLS